MDNESLKELNEEELEQVNGGTEEPTPMPSPIPFNEDCCPIKIQTTAP